MYGTAFSVLYIQNKVITIPVKSMKELCVHWPKCGNKFVLL